MKGLCSQVGLDCPLLPPPPTATLLSNSWAPMGSPTARLTLSINLIPGGCSGETKAAAFTYSDPSGRQEEAEMGVAFGGRAGCDVVTSVLVPHPPSPSGSSPYLPTNIYNELKAQNV